MVISIDELCEQLGINLTTAQRASPGKVSAETQFIHYEYNAIPSTKAVAPIICERLAGVETAVELGSHAGFRVLYYALNNPQTKFIAVDKNPQATEQLKKRIKKMRVPNIRLQTIDMYQLQGNFAAVLAIDCFDYTQFPSAVDKLAAATANYKFFGRKVDSSRTPSFFCTPFYNAPATGSHNAEMIEYHQRRLKEVNLSHLEIVPFHFLRLDGTPYTGRMLFASPKTL